MKLIRSRHARGRFFSSATTLPSGGADRDPVVARNDRADNDAVVKLAEDFNKSQSEYKVVPVYKGTYAETLTAGIAAYRAGNAPRHHSGLRGRHRHDDGRQGCDQAGVPAHEGAGEPFDPSAYLPAVTGYYSTSNGKMLSFPFNSSSGDLSTRTRSGRPGSTPRIRPRPGPKFSRRPRSFTPTSPPAASRRAGSPGR